MTVKPTILIVEDEIRLCELVCELFTRANFNVLSANDATHGLALFDTHRIDVVLSDICLPDSDGVKMIAQMKQIRHNLNCQFHVMSGYSGYADNNVSSLGIANMFKKPDDVFAMPNRVTDSLKLVNN